MIELTVKSTIDGSQEKNLFFYPPGGKDVPLLVGLHTWSYNRFNEIENMLPRCQKRNWALLLPEFRGPNLQSNPRTTQACASELALQDVIDAVNFIPENYSISADKIFLLGGSGGGHMSLMLSAYAPKLWRAVSSWCPITDLAEWHEQNANYAPHISACCGGKPGTNDEIDKQYKQRSPITHVAKMKDANLFVHHGRFDKSVPYTHTVKLATELEKLKPEKFFFEIFDGGHELHYKRAFDWFDILIDEKTSSADKLSK